MCFNPKPALISQPKFGCDKKHIYPNVKITRKIKFLHYEEIEKYKNDNNFLWIPCGKCLACRISNANDYATRSVLESKQWKNNCFITLSYKPEKLPPNGTLRVKDIQDFFKRLRKHEKGIEPRFYKGKIEYPIRYFICGEYGDKTLRAHYHAAIFNWKPDDLKFFKFNKINQPLYLSKKLAKYWDNGFIIVGDLTFESAAYIARYTQKKIYKKHENIIKEMGRHKEFITSSRRGGIGLSVINNKEEFEKIKNNFGILMKINNTVKLKNIPRSLREKWKEIDALEYYTAAEKNRQRINKEFKDMLKKRNITEEEYKKQQNEITKDRLKKLKREAF